LIEANVGHQEVAMSFIRMQVLAFGIAASVLAIAACSSEPGGTATGEQSGASEHWRLPPDYNRGPQIRNNP
jgi:hypothetical protein